MYTSPSLYRLLAPYGALVIWLAMPQEHFHRKKNVGRHFEDCIKNNVCSASWSVGLCSVHRGGGGFRLDAHERGGLLDGCSAGARGRGGGGPRVEARGQGVGRPDEGRRLVEGGPRLQEAGLLLQGRGVAV